jgi:hypothetical protein
MTRRGKNHVYSYHERSIRKRKNNAKEEKMCSSSAVNPEQIISVLAGEIDKVFSELMSWFEKAGPLRAFNSPDEEWTINQILEHVSLVSHYLLILIDKGARKALRRADRAKIEQELVRYELSGPLLEDIGINNSFEWESPPHMEPTGARSPGQIQDDLLEQKPRLMDYLVMLKYGEGVLCKTSMSVHSLGKLDVYQYIYFLLKHMRRHIQQMEGIEEEYNERR